MYPSGRGVSAAVAVNVTVWPTLGSWRCGDDDAGGCPGSTVTAVETFSLRPLRQCCRGDGVRPVPLIGVADVVVPLSRPRFLSRASPKSRRRPDVCGGGRQRRRASRAARRGGPLGGRNADARSAVSMARAVVASLPAARAVTVDFLRRSSGASWPSSAVGGRSGRIESCRESCEKVPGRPAVAFRWTFQRAPESAGPPSRHSALRVRRQAAPARRQRCRP